MNVWCVFFVSDETLEWELLSIHATKQSAKTAAVEFDQEDLVKIEEWNVVL